MAPSKQWMQLVDNRLDETYLNGIQKFLDYAFRKTGEEYEIRCPCVKCCNTTLGTRKTVETHLLVYGIIQNYTFWYHRGECLGEPLSESESEYEDEDEDGDAVEECESEDEVEELLRDLYPNHDGGTDVMRIMTQKNQQLTTLLSSLQFLVAGATGKRLEQRHGSLSSSVEISEYEVGAFNKSALYANQKVQTPSKRARSNTPMSSSQEMQTMDKLVLHKVDMQTNISLPPSIDQVTKHSQTTEKGSSTPKKEKRVRGSNKCKEVASLENGQKLKVTFYNNRTVGTNSKLFSRHLGKIVRDRNICPLGVSSWSDISQEKLDHIWAAVENKFESVDMNDHRDHILGWMNELWNKWRGYLHVKYVKDKPIQQSLKEIPRGVDKKEWKWLVKEHFASESFQARSSRNATNRAKLKMLPHIGSKPIREIIYQKGGKDGNPPDLATIFFETRKKDNKLVEPEAIEKHAQLEEMVQADPSMPTIEIVEKCCGPQTRSHVFGFGGGVKAKDLKGGTASKAEILSALRSTREDNKSLNEENKSLNEENKSLNNRLSTLENEMKEIRKMQEFFAAQQPHVPPATSSVSTE